jgi:diguanylate cyclase (GGDEF)-like protein
MTAPTITAQLQAAFEAFLEAHFIRRDKTVVDTLLDPSVTGFGTSRTESTFGDMTLQELFARDLADAPETLRSQINHLDIRPLASDCGLVVSSMDIATTIARQRLTLHDLRMTVVLCHQGNGWRIVHLHISLPTTEHDDHESYPVKELEERNAVLSRLVDERTEQLNAALSHHRQMAVTDPLTGLYNRRMLDEQLGIDMERAERYQSSFAVLMLDIDHFKSINDRFGHQQGDRFLIQFAELIRARLRKSDLAGRWGGEEFLVVCHGSTLADARTLAEDIRLNTEAADFGIGESRTVSIGVAEFIQGDSITTLIERADRGLYLAKESGRNRTCTTPDGPPQ